MPIPLLFIGLVAVSSATGLGSTIKAGIDQNRAKSINQNSEQRIDGSANRLENLRKQCGTALEVLGHEKIFVLNGSVNAFLTSFRKIKNVDFTQSAGLLELHKLHIDQKSFDALEKMGDFASAVAKGSLAGIAGGTIAAYGAYSAAATLATASTGTAIGTLSGAAATNATLAFFGGGSLAAGGMGMLAGTAILGGLVAGPALLVLGMITGAKAGKKYENAKSHAAEADVICEQFEAGSEQCIAIRRRTYMFYSLLARLDAYFMPLIHSMEEIIRTEGVDYSIYSMESKRTIAKVASIAVTIKSILDTPILSDNGSLTEESGAISSKIKEKISALEV